MSLKLTESQRAAIETRGEAILVSAGAGSGKTRVLVERLMSYVTDEKEPKDVDSFLIITFTRAAAAELRDRISRRLGELYAENPADRRLRRQVALCARAQIGTIHSFCTSILREKAQLLGLAPDFRVAEESRCAVIQQRVLTRVLEKAYAHIGEDAEFRALADTVGAGRDDSKLESVVLELYKKMSGHSYPEKWAEDCARRLELDAISDAAQTVWGSWLLTDAGGSALAWAARLETLLRQAAEQPDVMKAYGGSLADTVQALYAFARAAQRGWDEARACLPIVFPRLGALRNPQDPDFVKTVKTQRELCKKAMENLAERISAASGEVLGDLRAAAPAARALLRLTVDFSRAYAAEKRRLSLLDFSDLEHYAVKLLLDEQTGLPSAAARELAARYTEIMVDEYQDVNAVQDAIFTAVSREGKNLFMVGDVKQSIYRFRLADPTIFMRKYEQFGRNEGGRRILLQENFRSRPEVLEAVNHVFGRIMSKALGEIDYDEEARLIPGGSFPAEAAGSVECFVVEPEADEDRPDKPDKLEAEAECVARKIRELVDGGTLISAESGVRRLRWDDIAVLLRSPNSSGGAFRRAMEAQGIPVHAEQGVDLFSAPESVVMLHLFMLADNPRQDLPLISVLRSALFGMTADELAAVRAAAPKASFYTALCLRAETDEKCARFLETLAALRQDAADLPLGAFVWSVYARSGALALAAALPGGAAKRENLLRLFALAQRFEESGGATLSGFVDHLNTLREQGMEPAAPAQGGAVHLMSIHKSKGLEFPVVFLSGCSKQFNKQDARAEVSIHAQLGLGFRRMDISRGVEYPTLAQLAVSRKLLLEGLGEEMRVLYVAMTRAKERLFITCGVRDADKTLEKLRAAHGGAPDACVLETAQSVADWLLSAFLAEDSPVMIEFADGENAPVPDAPLREEVIPDAEAFDAKPMLDYRYPYAAAETLPVKLTATELKSRARERIEDEEAASLLPAREQVFREPELGESRKLTGAEKGTATHRLLQYMDPEQGENELALEAEIERLCAEGRLRTEEAGAIDRAAVVRFFRSETGALLRGGKTVLREQRFSLLAPAEDYFPDGAGEEILLQGIVDCIVVEDDGVTVLDFKTDHVWAQALQARAEEYALQLRVYAKAMARLLQKPVKRCVLVFLFTGESVEIPLTGK